MLVELSFQFRLVQAPTFRFLSCSFVPQISVFPEIHVVCIRVDRIQSGSELNGDFALLVFQPIDREKSQELGKQSKAGIVKAVETRSQTGLNHPLNRVGAVQFSLL